MKKLGKKFLQIIMLISMIFSSFQAPIQVFAAEIASNDNEPQIGDMKIGENGTISETNYVSTKATSTDGKVEVTKTVTAYDGQTGKYKVDFAITGKESETEAPVYVVIVFDTSGSMCSISLGICWNWLKWNNAVSAAQEFAGTIIDSLPNSKVALVTFDSDAYQARGFEHSYLDEDDFGSPGGGTNLHDGLLKAQDYLSNEIPDADKANAKKYIVIMSDGEPTFYNEGGSGQSTSEEILNATLNTAKTIKDNNTEIYSIGYALPSGDVYKDDYTWNGTTYDGLTAKEILQLVASTDTEEDISNGINHYQDASSEDNIVETFKKVAKSIVIPGKNATLVDNIGSNFKVVNKNESTVDGTYTSSESGFGGNYTSGTITEITKETITISFDIEINPDSTTGWYNTNAGFKLTYTDASGEEQEITSSEDPYVYWIQKTYDYVVNYYKDSINTDNLIASDTRQAIKDTIIDATNVEKDKYLQTAGVGYEFNSVSPTSITITNDGEVKTINVLYTLKEYSYDVNYYYDSIKDTTLSYTVTDVIHGTEVSPSDYYLDSTNIKEGYTLDTVSTDSSSIIIDDAGKSINIYYTKASYEYIVNYYFNNTIDNNLTQKEQALYQTVINSSDKYLTDETLSENNYSDYFLHPTVPSNPSQLTIGVNNENNIINIYYINTFAKDETINKVSKTTSVEDSETLVSYEVTYQSTAKNIKANEKIIITIIDTLPYEIDETKSNLNGGVYKDKTITWTIEKTITEFTETYNINETITYQVVYKDFADLSSQKDNNLINSVIGKTTIGNKTTIGTGDSTTTPVEIYGNVIVKHVDESGNELSTQTNTSGLVGADYTTEKATIYGYSYKSDSGNTTGKYTEEDITVTYVYTKNTGSTKTNEVEKTQINQIIGANSSFKYVLTYNGEIENYVGDATITLTDTLPYEISSIEYDEAACTLNGNILTCSKTKAITETDKTISARFEIIVTYKNLTSTLDLEITNKVDSLLTYGANSTPGSDEVTSTVKSGKVTAIYVDEEDNEIASQEEMTGLINTDYQTTEKTIYGYTIKSNSGNTTGKYTEADITVTYVYTKNTGLTKTNEVEKTQINQIIGANSTFKYVLTYNGEIENYVGDATITLTDTLPYEISSIEYDEAACTLDGNILTCSKTKAITETDKTISARFEIIVTYKNLTSTLDLEITNKVDSLLTYGENSTPGSDEVTSTVKSGKVTAIYVDEEDNEIASQEEMTGLVNTDYQTTEKTIYGYTIKSNSGNTTGKYTEADITVTYVYTKNIGTSVEEFEKTGSDIIKNINDPFEYTITYNAQVSNYVGIANITITDILPYEIDLEKSTIGDNCKYEDNKVVCQYTKNITDEESGKINIEENFILYYINVDSSAVSNKAQVVLTYGDVEIFTDDEFITEVEEGTLKVNYVTDKGVSLSSSVITMGIIGSEYTTKKLAFDNYYLKEVIGQEIGTYSSDETVVTYVYSEIPLPPQTGVETTNNNYFGLFISMFAFLILRRKFVR